MGRGKRSLDAGRYRNLISFHKYSATAHKVEVNPDFGRGHVPQDIPRDTKKMITPQLYEQLPVGTPFLINTPKD